MEESLIWAKNRHMFGGIEPSCMRKFRVYKKDGNVRIEALLPLDTVVDGQTLCTVAGAVIRRKEGDYPVDEFDGVEVANIKSDSDFIDSSVDVNADVDQYYAAFPYTAQGVFNRSTSNRAKFLSKAGYWVFGYDLDVVNSDPDKRVSYPPDVDNYGWTPVGFNGALWSYGDWPSTPGEFFMPRPCMLTYDGVVDHYLDPNDYSKQLDGVTPSRVSDLTFNGNAMVEWPKIYTHREVVNGIYKFRCSDVALDDDWDCWCNYDKNNNQVDHFYTAIYPGFYRLEEDFKVDGRHILRSISGVDIAQNATGSYSALGPMMDLCKANGEGWDLECIAERLLIQDLLVLMGKSTNGQAVYGSGDPGSTSAVIVGQHTDKIGMFGWYAGTHKVFGMESWWGMRDRRIAGLILNYTVLKVKVTPGTHDGSSVVGYNTTGSGYRAFNFSNLSSVNGYITSMSIQPFGRLPVTDEGSASTYECDYVVYNTNVGYSGAVVAYSSGNSQAGPFALYLNLGVEGTTSVLTGALSYRPTAKVD